MAKKKKASASQVDTIKKILNETSSAVPLSIIEALAETKIAFLGEEGTMAVLEKVRQMETAEMSAEDVRSIWDTAHNV